MCGCVDTLNIISLYDNVNVWFKYYSMIIFGMFCMIKKIFVCQLLEDCDFYIYWYM